MANYESIHENYYNAYQEWIKYKMPSDYKIVAIGKKFSIKKYAVAKVRKCK